MILALLFACRQTLSSPHEPLGDPTAAWNSVLRRSVTEDGLVDYDVLERNRLALDEYVAWCGREKSAPITPKRRLAFWLNAYNALVLWTVLYDERPASVLDVPGRFLPTPGAGFFVERQYRVGLDSLSLWELEHERIRERSQDYRVHAALNCASMSCPPLRPELYVGEHLDDQLADQMRRWVEDPERGARVEGGELVLSPLFDGYRRDFTEWTAGMTVCEVVARHATGALGDQVRALDGCPHRFTAYDWRLNDSG